jgi:hypothetical protein
MCERNNNVHPVTDELIEFLNSALALDRVFMTEMVERRLPCNEGIANHPSIQIQDTRTGADTYCCGFLGLINGFCGVASTGWGPIAAIYKDDQPYRQILKFVRRKDPCE